MLTPEFDSDGISHLALGISVPITACFSSENLSFNKIALVCVNSEVQQLHW